jgi:hypothetical protein
MCNLQPRRACARALHDSSRGRFVLINQRTPLNMHAGTICRGYLDYVIPAKAGIQANSVGTNLDVRCAGMTSRRKERVEGALRFHAL